MFKGRFCYHFQVEGKGAYSPWQLGKDNSFLLSHVHIISDYLKLETE
jgi:hypothetical protein